MFQVRVNSFQLNYILRLDSIHHPKLYLATRTTDELSTCFVSTSRDIRMAGVGAKKLFFDPDQHPEETLKAFDEFVQDFKLYYAANYPDPPKVSMDAAIQRWKIENGNAEPNVNQFDVIKEAWQTKDMVAKFLGLHVSRRIYTDWKAAQPTEAARKASTWDNFMKKLQTYYKPT